MKRFLIILLTITFTTGMAVFLIWVATMYTGLDEILGVHGLSAISFSLSLLIVSLAKNQIEKKITPPEILSRQKDEQNDERNKTLIRQAASISWCINIFAFGIMLFLLAILNYTVPSIMALAVFGINCFSFIIALSILKKKY